MNKNFKNFLKLKNLIKQQHVNIIVIQLVFDISAAAVSNRTIYDLVELNNEQNELFVH